MVSTALKAARRIAAGGGHDGAEARLRGLVAFRLNAGTRLRLGPRIEFVGRTRITLGDYVALGGNSVFNAGGEHGRIEIGDHSHVDWFCVVYGQGGVTIGRGCAIAAGVMIYSQSNQYRSNPAAEILKQPTVYSRVLIGEDVWIGAGAKILPGVHVGSHAVIAAGAVVQRDIPEWSVAAGVPARILHDRRSPPKRRTDEHQPDSTSL